MIWLEEGIFWSSVIESNLFCFIESSDDRTDFVLGGLDILGSLGAEEFDIFLELGGGAFGEGGEDRFCHAGSSGFQGWREASAVDIAENALEIDDAESCQIFEAEDLFANGRAEGFVAFVHAGEERLASFFIESVEDFDTSRNATTPVKSLGIIALTDVPVEVFGDGLDAFSGGRFHEAETFENLFLESWFEESDDFRSFGDFHTGDDERDGLGLFATDEVEHHGSVHGADLLIGSAPVGGFATVDDCGSGVVAFGQFEGGLSKSDASESGVGAFFNYTGKLFEDEGLNIRGNERHGHHFATEGFELGLLETFHDLGSGFGADGDEKGGHLLDFGEFCVVHGGLAFSSGTHPTAEGGADIFGFIGDHIIEHFYGDRFGSWGNGSGDQA